MNNRLCGVEGVDYIVSRLNGTRYRTITTFHVRKEGLKNLDEYRKMFPDAPFECSDVKRKWRDTNLERHGVEYPVQSKIICDKMINTNLERYGVENSMQSRIIRQRHVNVCLDRYGVENVSQIEGVKRKKCETCLGHFGVEYPMQSDIVLKKAIMTTLDHFGVDRPAQNITIRDRMINTNLERYGVGNAMQDKDISIKCSASRRGIDLEDNRWLGFIYELGHYRSHVDPENKCIKLNNRFKNSHAHHILRNVVVYIPGELHNRIYHNLRTGDGMDTINALTFQYLNGYYNG